MRDSRLSRTLVFITVLVVCASLMSAQETPEDPAEKAEKEAYAAAWSAAVDAVTPEGYLYEELRRCAGCHDASRNEDGNSTHRNAIGISGDPDTPIVTGKGWISGAHGRSQDTSVVSNTHCAWCHAPSQPGVTAEISEAEPISSGRVGVSCISCHASEAVNDTFGTYQANFRAGGDRDSLVDFIARDPKDGVATNSQCLYCHLDRHEFSIEPHGRMTDEGSLRCIDCHMAIYNRLESGVEERYHNMKVGPNNEAAVCRPCHEFASENIASLCEMLVPERDSIVHGVPAFE